MKNIRKMMEVVENTGTEEKIKIDDIQIFNMWVSALKIKVSGKKKTENNR